MAASAAFLVSDREAAVRLSLWARKAGIAMAARMPMMMITINSSMRVKPRSSRSTSVQSLSLLAKKLKHTSSPSLWVACGVLLTIVKPRCPDIHGDVRTPLGGRHSSDALDPLYAEVLIPPSLVGPLPADVTHEILVIGPPGRTLGDDLANEVPGAFASTVPDFATYDFVTGLRTLVWTVAGLVLAIGLLAFAVAAIDRVVERRKEMVALQLVGVPASLLRRAQWVEALVPIVIGSAFAVGLGAMAGATYLTLDSEMSMPWGQAAGLAGVAACGGALVAGLTVLASAPRIRASRSVGSESVEPVGLPDHVDDAVHDLGEAEVLGRVDRSDPLLDQPAPVGVGDDPADDHRYVAQPGLAQPLEHRRHQLHVRAGEDRQPDAVHVLGDGGGDDLLGGQPDALVDHLEARVASAYGDLLGAVGVTVEAGLADQQPQPAAELLAGLPDPAPDRGQLGARLGDATAPLTPSGRGTPRRPRAGCRPTPPSSRRHARRPASDPSGWCRSWRQP